MAIKKTRTQCTTCHARCGVFVYSDEDNNIVKIEGDPDNPKSFGVVCGAGMSQREVHNNVEGRILYPMKPRRRARRTAKWERITWDEALDTIAGRQLQAHRRPNTAPRPSSPGRAPAAPSNHWHVPAELVAWDWKAGRSSPPTCASCPTSCRTPSAWASTQPRRRATWATPNTIVLWGQNPAMERAHHEASSYARQDAGGEPHRRRHALPGHVEARRPGHPAAARHRRRPRSRHHPRGRREQAGTTRSGSSNWTYGFDELARARGGMDAGAGGRGLPDRCRTTCARRRA